MLVLPERTSVVPLSPEQDNSWAVTHPSLPAPCRGMGPGCCCWYEYRWDTELVGTALVQSKGAAALP